MWTRKAPGSHEVLRMGHAFFAVVLALTVVVASCTTTAPAPAAKEPEKKAASPAAKQETTKQDTPKEAKPEAKKEAAPSPKQEPKMERVKLNVSYTTANGSQSTLPVPKDAGLFDKYGLDVNVMLIAGGTKAITAMMAGDVAFTLTAGPPVIEADLAGGDIVMILSVLGTLDHVIVAKSDVKNPQGLKGKRIAINRFGSLDDFAARIALRKWGLEPEKDVALLQIGEQPARFAALEAGGVDATPIQPPLTAVARKKGYVELPPLSEMGADYQSTVLITTRSFISKNEDVVRRFVKAYVEGLHYFKTNKQATMKSIQDFMKLEDQAAIEEAYDKYAKMLPETPYPNMKGIQTVLDDIASTNPKAKGSKPDDFVDIRFVKELDDSGFIKKLYGK